MPQDQSREFYELSVYRVVFNLHLFMVLLLLPGKPLFSLALAIILPGLSVIAQDITILFSPCDGYNPVHAVGGSDGQFGIQGLYTLGGCFATEADALSQGYNVSTKQSLPCVHRSRPFS
jgi:hypothetical protein